MSILAYGVLNPDLVHRVERLPSPGEDLRSISWRFTWGGKVANAAVAIAGWGGQVRLSGLVIGRDELGRALLASLSRPGIVLSEVEVDPNVATGHCVVIVDSSGDRTIVCTGYEDSRWTQLGPGAWRDVDVVLLDGFSGAAGRTVAEEANRRDVAVVWIDPDPLETHLATVAVWSSGERSNDDWSASSAATTILTAGDGPVRYRPGGGVVIPPPVEVVDATGSGDVFAGAVAFGISSGWAIERFVVWATAAGAALAARGRDTGMPTFDEVEELVSGVRIVR